MTASELQDLIITRLVRQSGGTRRRWRIVLGPVRIYDRATHPLCNWNLFPQGGAREVETVERLLDEVRLEHSIVAPD